MKKLKFLFFPTILALAFGLMLSCAKSSSEDSSSSEDTSSSADTSSSSTVTLSGKVQKGPYVQGTEITVRELDSSMIPTGNTFTGPIDDHAGNFIIKGTLAYKIVELSADGYYFNEVSGSLSSAKLTLQALSDLTDSNSVNVNLMTHLEKKRVEYLMDFSKMTLAAAKTQAQTEILKIFNIENVTLGNSETLDISKSGDGNAVLLAISALLQSNKSEAELTELLSVINTDIRTDGTLDGSNTKQILETAMEYLKPIRSTIRSNIESRYSYLGLSANIPAFESYAFKLDTDLPTIASKDITYGTDTLVSSVKVVFSEIMDNTSLSSNTFYIAGTSGNAISGVVTSSESSTSTSVTFTPSENLSTSDNYSATITTGVKDLTGNGLVEKYSFNLTRPSITISTSEGTDGFSSSNSQLSLTFTISENTDNFVVGDVSVSNASLSSFTGSGKTYTSTLTPSAQGEVKINIAEGTFTNNSGNINIAATEFNWTYDTTNPTVTISASQGSDGFTSKDSTLSLTFTSTKATSNFDVNDITITNGALSSFTASSSTTYAATFTPSSDGAVTIDVGANKFTGPAGNSNTASGQFNWTYDSTGPTVSSTSPSNSATSINPSTSISATFSEGMDTSTITTNTSNTSCSGSLQVSTDSNFNSCLQMSSGPVASNSNKTFTITPTNYLTSITNYKIRITNAVKDSSDNSLNSQYTTNNGFTVESYTSKSGVISSDETWSETNSPYLVTDDIRIDNGVTLTVDSGVIVKFKNNKSIQNKGTLHVLGTPSNKVKFTSSLTNPSSGDWAYLDFADQTIDANFDSSGDYDNGTLIKNAVIEYGGGNSSNGAVTVTNSAIYLDNVTIQYSASNGIYFSKSTGGTVSVTVIDNSTISNNSNHGIYCNCYQYNKSLTVLNSTISNNNGGGISTGGGDAGGSHTFNYTNNYIINNGGTGITANANGTQNIRKNIIDNNTSYGVRSRGNGTYTIENNYITHNNSVGIHGIYATHVIEKNIVGFNKGGLEISQGGSYKVNYNLIYSNNNGGDGSAFDPYGGTSQSAWSSPVNIGNNTIIFNTSTSATLLTFEPQQGDPEFTVNHNNIYSNTATYEIKNYRSSSKSDINAENNYWGTTSSSSIASKIYDWSEESTKGTVDYNPFSNSLITTAPISPPTNTSASAGSSSFTLSWSANSESDRTGYKVYWDTDSGHPYANVQDVGNVTSKTISGLSSGTTYYVTVTAYDSTYSSGNDNSSTIINENQTAGNESWYAEEKTVVSN